MKVLNVSYHIEGKKEKGWAPFGGTYETNISKAKKQFARLKKSCDVRLRLVEEKKTVVG